MPHYIPHQSKLDPNAILTVLSQALLAQPVPGATNEVEVLDQPLVINTALMARGAFR
jgi:hypothetical protein